MVDTRVRYDAVIVGAGVSALPIIDALSHSNSDLRVLVVEREDVAGPFSTKGVRKTQARNIPFLFSDCSGTEPSLIEPTWSTSFAGGGFNYWYGQLSRFRASDFGLSKAEHVAGLTSDERQTIRDWSFNYDDLVPYYEQAESALSSFGSSYGYTPDERVRLDGVTFLERPYISHFERQLIDLLRFKGWYPYVGATSLGGRAWEEAPVDPISLEGISDALQFRARWFSAMWDAIRHDRRFSVIGHSRVSEIILDGERVAGVHIVVDAGDGAYKQMCAYAPLVVLACGPIETTSILLRSPIHDTSGMTGANFTCNVESVGYITTDIERSFDVKDLLCGRFANVSIKDIYDPPKKSGIISSGKISIYDAISCETDRKIRAYANKCEPSLNASISSGDKYVLKASFKGYSMPSASKKLGRSDQKDGWGIEIPHIFYTPHDHDERVSTLAEETFKRIADDLPGGRLFILPRPEGHKLITAHARGGAISGLSRHDSVVDMNCQHWGARGLFVADASSHANSGGTNVSLTVLANSLRVAEFIRSFIH